VTTEAPRLTRRSWRSGGWPCASGACARALRLRPRACGPGELVGLIGPNGAGKTTAFNAITGVYAPTEGEVRGARRAGRTGCARTASASAAWPRTFQNVRLFRELTALRQRAASPATPAWRSRLRLAAWWLTPRHLRRGGAASPQRADEFLDGAGPRPPQRRARAEPALRASSGGWRSPARWPPGPGCSASTSRRRGPTPRRRWPSWRSSGASATGSGSPSCVIEHDMRLVMGVSERVLVLDHGVHHRPRPARRRSGATPKVIEAYLGDACQGAAPGGAFAEAGPGGRTGEVGGRTQRGAARRGTAGEPAGALHRAVHGAPRRCSSILAVKDLVVHYGVIQRAGRGRRSRSPTGGWWRSSGRTAPGRRRTLRAISGMLRPAAGQVGSSAGTSHRDALPRRLVAPRHGPGAGGRGIFLNLTVPGEPGAGRLPAPRPGADRAGPGAGLRALPHPEASGVASVADAVGRRAADAGGGPGADEPARCSCSDEPSLGLAPQVVDRISRCCGRINRSWSVDAPRRAERRTRPFEIAHQACAVETGSVATRGTGRELPRVAPEVGRAGFTWGSERPCGLRRSLAGIGLAGTWATRMLAVLAEGQNAPPRVARAGGACATLVAFEARPAVNLRALGGWIEPPRAARRASPWRSPTLAARSPDDAAAAGWLAPPAGRWTGPVLPRAPIAALVAVAGRLGHRAPA